MSNCFMWKFGKFSCNSPSSINKLCISERENKNRELIIVQMASQHCFHNNCIAPVKHFTLVVLQGVLFAHLCLHLELESRSVPSAGPVLLEVYHLCFGPLELVLGNTGHNPYFFFIIRRQAVILNIGDSRVVKARC